MLHPEGRGLDAVGKPRRLRIEQRDDVDVARIVELAGAVLPHAEDEEARAPPCRRVHWPARAASASAKRSAAAERRVGEAGEERGDRFQSNRAGEVGEPERQRHILLGAAQRRHRLRRASPTPPLRAPRPAARRAASGGSVEDRGEPRDVLRSEVEEIGAVAERVAEEGRQSPGRRAAAARAIRARPAARPLRAAVPAPRAACGRCGQRRDAVGAAPQAARPAAAPGTCRMAARPGLLSVSTKLAAMQLRHRGDEAQAQPGAGLGAALLQPHEALGHARAVGLGDAGAVVGDAESHDALVLR